MQTNLLQPVASAEANDSRTASDEAVVCKELLAAAKRESAFYRHLLEQIAAQDGRKTRARRLAESGMTFWDMMKKSKKSATEVGASIGLWKAAND